MSLNLTVDPVGGSGINTVKGNPQLANVPAGAVPEVVMVTIGGKNHQMFGKKKDPLVPLPGKLTKIDVPIETNLPDHRKRDHQMISVVPVIQIGKLLQRIM